MTDLTESNSRALNGRFTNGNPGGPGRPRRVVKAAADALDERLAQASGDLYDLAIGMAREGNEKMLKMLLDRLWPAGRSRPLEIGALEIKHPRDLLTAMNGVTGAVLTDGATAEEGAAVAKVLKAHLTAIETVELEERLVALEKNAGIR